jgi:glycerol-3-phosphate cytidylyltransferase-like family protein
MKLRKLIERLLGEGEIKDVVVVYSGRFQPFHAGHNASYRHLVKKFGKDNVFIGTSDKTDTKKSPFNFKEKVMIMSKMFGVPKSKIVMIKNPYAPVEILKRYDEDTTAFVTVVGKKDADRLGGKYFTPYTGEFGHGYKDKGYVYISSPQSNGLSGTEVREKLGGEGDMESKKEIFTKLYPKFDKGVFELITSKLAGLK